MECIFYKVTEARLSWFGHLQMGNLLVRKCSKLNYQTGGKEEHQKWDLPGSWYTWDQDTLGHQSMIYFVIVSSAQWPYVLDTQVKWGAEGSNDHHLVVSWINWQGRMLDRPGRPKFIMSVCWECVAVNMVFSVVYTFNGVLQSMVVLWLTPEAAGQVIFSSGGCRDKCLGVGRVWEGHGARLPFDAEEILANCRVAQEGKAASPPHSLQCWRGSSDLNWIYGWAVDFIDLPNPTNTQKAEPKDSGMGSLIIRVEVLQVIQQLQCGSTPGVDGIHPEFLKGLEL